MAGRLAILRIKSGDTPVAHAQGKPLKSHHPDIFHLHRSTQRARRSRRIVARESCAQPFPPGKAPNAFFCDPCDLLRLIPFPNPDPNRPAGPAKLAGLFPHFQLPTKATAPSLAAIGMAIRHSGSLPAMPSSATSRPNLRSARIVDGRSWIVDGRSWLVDGRSWITDGRSWIVDGRSWIADAPGGALSPRAHADGTRTNRPSLAQRTSLAPLVHYPSSCGLIETALPLSQSKIHNQQSTLVIRKSHISLPMVLPVTSGAVQRVHRSRQCLLVGTDPDDYRLRNVSLRGPRRVNRQSSFSRPFTPAKPGATTGSYATPDLLSPMPNVCDLGLTPAQERKITLANR